MCSCFQMERLTRLKWAPLSSKALCPRHFIFSPMASSLLSCDLRWRRRDILASTKNKDRHRLSQTQAFFLLTRSSFMLSSSLFSHFYYFPIQYSWLSSSLSASLPSLPFPRSPSLSPLFFCVDPSLVLWRRPLHIWCAKMPNTLSPAVSPSDNPN